MPVGVSVRPFIHIDTHYTYIFARMHALFTVHTQEQQKAEFEATRTHSLSILEHTSPLLDTMDDVESPQDGGLVNVYNQQNNPTHIIL